MSADDRATRQNDELNLDMILAKYDQQSRIGRAQLIQSHCDPLEREDAINRQLRHMMYELAIGRITFQELEQIEEVLRGGS